MEEQFKFIKKHAQEGFYCYAGDNPPGLKGGQANEDVLTLLQALRDAEEQRDQALDQVAAAVGSTDALHGHLQRCIRPLRNYHDQAVDAIPWDVIDLAFEEIKDIQPTAQAHAERLRQEGREEERGRIVKAVEANARLITEPGSPSGLLLDTADWNEIQQPTDAAEGGAG